MPLQSPAAGAQQHAPVRIYGAPQPGQAPTAARPRAPLQPEQNSAMHLPIGCNSRPSGVAAIRHNRRPLQRPSGVTAIRYNRNPL